MNRRRTILLLCGASVLAACFCAAQGWRGGGRGGGSESYVPDDARTAREIQPHSKDANGVIIEIPNWTNAPGFEQDVLTFARIKRERSSVPGGPWETDAPDSDLNLSFRLQQMTSLKVDPNGRFLSLTDKELAGHPFIYMVEPSSLLLSDEEATALRKYLLNGGFVWLDDFWGEVQWQGMARQFAKVFPDRKFVELELTHPLYHTVFDIKSKGQVPNVVWGEREQYPQYAGVTWEVHEGEACKEVHHRAILDDKGRIMVFATHNSDNGDGWEREGENHYYFEHYSEKFAYPLAVNVLFYVMTH